MLGSLDRQRGPARGPRPAEPVTLKFVIRLRLLSSRILPSATYTGSVVGLAFVLQGHPVI